MEALEQNCASTLAKLKCPPTVVQRVRSCVQDLEREAIMMGSSWRLRIFGSFSNGLCVSTSDLDATVYSVDPAFENTHQARIDVLTHLRERFLHGSRVVVTDLITAARVPILKVRYEDALEVDLSCNNTEPFRNTQMLRAYTELSPLVKDVMLLIKSWAKSLDMVGAKDGNLSSYSFALMVIYFLQTDDQVCMPLLHTEIFDGGTAVPPAAKIRWLLNVHRSVLLYWFFNFYATVFHWGEEVVAVHLGRKTSRHDPIHAKVSDISDSRLHIVDPFLTHRNLNCVLKYDKETALYKQFLAAADQMLYGSLPRGLYSPSTADDIYVSGVQLEESKLAQYAPVSHNGNYVRAWPTYSGGQIERKLGEREHNIYSFGRFVGAVDAIAREVELGSKSKVKMASLAGKQTGVTLVNGNRVRPPAVGSIPMPKLVGR